MTGADFKRQDEPWFSGKPGTIVLYKVNRRPHGQLSLFGDGSQPGDVMDHIVEVLLFGEEVETGRRNKRYWRLGNRRVDDRQRILMGQVGWESSSVEAAARYDMSRREWVDAVGERGRTARAPFAFDADTRILGILKHPTLERVLPEVFKTLLRRGESARSAPTTDWDVEPILDTQGFRNWLRSIDVLDKVQFVAKLPNPDALEEFGPVWDRMEQHKARLLREVMEAADPEIGLVDLEGDRVVNAYISMSEGGYGYVTAEGSREGQTRRFDQRASVARRQTDPLPSSWTEVLDVVIDYVRERRRQRRAP